jgi:hypothetical protein
MSENLKNIIKIGVFVGIFGGIFFLYQNGTISKLVGKKANIDHRTLISTTTTPDRETSSSSITSSPQIQKDSTTTQNITSTEKEKTDVRLAPPTVAVLEVDSVDAINVAEVTKQYFKKYKETNDFLAIFNYGGSKNQYHLTVKNNTKGIHNPDYIRTDESTTYGSNGTLLGIGVVGNINQYPSDKPIYNVLLEEVFAHYWGVYIGDVIDSLHQLPLQNTLTRGHWTSCLNFLDKPDTARYWKANHWKKVGQNKWEFVHPAEGLPRFDPVLLYLMGYLEASKVPDVELIIPNSEDKTLVCNENSTIEGTSRIISIEEIIDYLGPREPLTNPKKNYSVGYILLVNHGTTPSASSIETIERVASKLPEVFHDAITYSPN